MKPLWKSKTAWLNFGVVALGAAGQAFNIPVLNDPQTMGYILAGANVINRFFTDGKVNLVIGQKS